MEFLEKNLLCIRVYTLAETFSLDKVAVNKIINTYISTVKESLVNGQEVRILGIVSLVPSVVSDPYIATTAYFAKSVSDKLSISYQTCLEVLKEYIVSLRNEILNGVSVDIRSVASLHPVFENKELVGVHTSVSLSVKRDLLKLNGDAISLRAHTCKLLKSKIKSTGLINKGVV